MSDNNITFAQYLIKLGAKKNWFPEGSAKFYFSIEHSNHLKELAKKQFKKLDNVFSNLYSFNFVTVDESNLPYHKGGIGAVLLKSKGFEIAVRQ